jgi:hypothetical protein
MSETAFCDAFHLGQVLMVSDSGKNPFFGIKDFHDPCVA